MKVMIGFLLAFCICSLAYAQTIMPNASNLSFETVKDGVPISWNLYDGNDFSGGKALLQSEQSIHGHNAIELVASHPDAITLESDPYIVQCIDVPGLAGKIITVTAAVRLIKGEESQNASAHIWLWQRSPAAHRSASPYLKTSSDSWVKLSLQHKVDGDSKGVCFGGSLYGRHARAWFDNFEISIQ
jgi:hypothetical protein